MTPFAFKPWIYWLILGLAAVYVIGVLTSQFLVIPNLDWNAMRLTTAAALAHGYDIYPGLDAGPLLSSLYPPVSHLLYLPATLISRPSMALYGAGLINGFLIFVPFFVLLWKEFQHSPNRPLLVTMGMIVFATLISITPTTNLILYRIHVDAAAVGLGLAAIAALTHRSTYEHTKPLILSALFLSLSIWSKQTMVFLGAGILIYLALCHGTKAVRAYSIALSYTLLPMSLLFMVLFGFQDLYTFLVDLPARHTASHNAASILGSFWTSLWINFVPVAKWVVLTGVIGVLASYWPRIKEFTSQHEQRSIFKSVLRPIPQPLKTPSLVLLVICAIALTPISLFSLFRPGGALNGLHHHYFFIAAVCLLLLHLIDRKHVLALLLPLILIGPYIEKGPEWQKLSWRYDQAGIHIDALYRTLQDSNAQIYLPWHGFISLTADATLHNQADGINIRKLAGLPLSHDGINAFTPKAPDYIILPRGNVFPRSGRLTGADKNWLDFQKKTYPDYVALTPEQIRARNELRHLSPRVWTVFAQQASTP